LKQLLIAYGIEENAISNVFFDFLVGGKLLRGKIKSHVVRYEIGCEDVLDVEYFVAFREFQQSKQSPA
jgi:hypothetical protein